MSISRQRIELALKLLPASKWKRFEEIASDFLAAEWANLRTLASPSGDAGRDAILFCPEQDATVAIQYSVSENWRAKITATAKTVTGNFPETKILVYVTNQVIGAAADSIVKKLRDKFSIYLDVRDRNWFIERANQDEFRQDAAEKLAEEIVDPYISGNSLIESKAHALTTIEARAALVYLGLQWEDDTREKGLTKLCFDALVKTSLRATDPEHRMTRDAIKKAVRLILPSHDAARVDELTDSTINRLSKKVLKHYGKDNTYCLSYDEKERIKDRLSALEIEDRELEKDLHIRVSEYLDKQKITNIKIEPVYRAVREVLEKYLLSRGEIFASSITEGKTDNPSIDDLKPLVTTHVSENSNTLQHVRIIDIVMGLAQDVLDNPTPAIVGYLHNVADSYTLMAFLRETPDVQNAVVKIFSHGEIWLDTSIVLPLLAESLSEVQNKKITSILRATHEAGNKLYITRGVLEEVERHINRSIAYCRAYTAWKGRIPFLCLIYISTGRSPDAFESWTEAFRGATRPEDDVAEFLLEEFDIVVLDLIQESNSISDETRIAVKEEWTRIHGIRRGSGFEGDELFTMRLAEHDTENFAGIIGRRKKEKTPAPFGYRSWWLTLDSSAHHILEAIKTRIEHPVPSSPVLSPDFLINYLSFGPMRQKISKTTEASLPLFLAGHVLDTLPADLLELAQKAREANKDLPERVIRRRVRDELDNAKLRYGSVAAGGITKMEHELREQVPR